jgi:hypothetical protein
MVNDTFLNDQWVTEEIREKNQEISRIKQKWKYNLIEHLGHNKGSAKRKVTTISAYSEKSERSQMNNLIMHFKFLEREQTKAKIGKS